MKAQKKLTAGIAVAIIAVLVASQSVNHAAPPLTVKSKLIESRSLNSFSAEEIDLLMKANSWKREQAVRALELANGTGEHAK